MIEFKKNTLVYVPCHNCADVIAATLRGIPEGLHSRIEALVVDNDSTDGTSEAVLEEIRVGHLSFPVHLIRTRRDLGYAGSQKLAYSLAAASPAVKHVIMLHGDGQYPPLLIEKFLPFLEADTPPSVVNGYRDKSTYPDLDETPPGTYRIIKWLNRLENLITGFQQREWHSGFVMYSTAFLRKLPFPALTTTRHIDGEMLICAGLLGERTDSFPIYKKYKDYEAFSGLPKMAYVLDVLRIFLNYRKGDYKRLLAKNPPAFVNSAYDRL